MTNHHERLIYLYNRALEIDEMIGTYIDEIMESGLEETTVDYHAREAWNSMYLTQTNIQIRIDIEEDKETNGQDYL